MADDAKKTPPAKEDKEPGRSAPVDKESADGKEAAPAKSGKGLSPIMLIVAALVSLVVFLGVFSYMMGVFDHKPPVAEVKPAASTPADSAKAPAAHYYSDFGKAAAGLEAAARDSNAVDTFAQLTELARRKKEISTEEASLSAQKQELAALKKQVEEQVARKDAIANEKVLYLAKLLDGMKPEELSALMEKLDNTTILAVLPNMKPQNASKVLAMLPAERAAEITAAILTTPAPAQPK